MKNPNKRLINALRAVLKIAEEDAPDAEVLEGTKDTLLRQRVSLNLAYQDLAKAFKEETPVRQLLKLVPTDQAIKKFAAAINSAFKKRKKRIGKGKHTSIAPTNVKPQPKPQIRKPKA